jgi:hypothetical protein
MRAAKARAKATARVTRRSSPAWAPSPATTASRRARGHHTILPGEKLYVRVLEGSDTFTVDGPQTEGYVLFIDFL